MNIKKLIGSYRTQSPSSFLDYKTNISRGFSSIALFANIYNHLPISKIRVNIFNHKTSLWPFFINSFVNIDGSKMLPG